MTHTYAEPITLSVHQSDQDLEWDGDGFALAPSVLKGRTLKIEDDEGATELWRRKQDNALVEYQDSHVQEQVSPVTHAIYKLFGAYIGAALHGPDEKARPNVLDVGCGIGRRRPIYMRKLIDGVDYFGMDAFDPSSLATCSASCKPIQKMATAPGAASFLMAKATASKFSK